MSGRSGGWLAAALLCAATATAGELTPAPALNHGVWVDGIDLAVVPGPGGTAPRLRIGHDHRAPDGPLGTGFQLVGTSVISRRGPAGGVPSTAADASDAQFRLDGRRLLQIEEGPAIPRTRVKVQSSLPTDVLAWDHHYEPETFDGSRLQYDPITNTWIKEANGWTWTYGSTTGTGANATKMASPYWVMEPAPTLILPACDDGRDLCTTVAWYLSRVVDPAGNAATYDYVVPSLPTALSGRFDQIDTRDHLLSAVHYADGDARVDLEWSERPDPRMRTASGVPTVHAQRLVAVRSYGRNSAPYATYRVEYKDEDGLDCAGDAIAAADRDRLVDRPVQSLVRRLIREDVDTGAHRTLRCYETHDSESAWDGATTETVPDITLRDANTVLPVPVNLNGDGISDLLVLFWGCQPDPGGGSWPDCHAAHRAYIADPGGAAPFLTRDTAAAGSDAEAIIDTWESRLATLLDDTVGRYGRGFVIGDLDGDFAPDLLVETAEGVFMVDGAGGAQFEVPIDACTLRFSSLGDVDGDGRVDLIRSAHAEKGTCLAESTTAWIRNQGDEPVFDSADLVDLEMPLEGADLPDEWVERITPGMRATCDGTYRMPPTDYITQNSDPTLPAHHARFGDFNGDGVLDVAYALFGCFDWRSAGSYAQCPRYMPVLDSLYSRIFYGRGDGTFLDSGLDAGPAVIESDVVVISDPAPECRAMVRTHTLSAMDVDRSGHPALLRSHRDLAGNASGAWRGLVDGFALDPATGLPDGVVVPAFSGTANPRIESNAFADFDGDGFVDALSLEHVSSLEMHLYASIRTVAQGRVIERRGKSGGATALGWGFSARHDNPELPFNLEVLETTDGARGLVERRYAGGSADEDGFTGFAYAARENARGGVDAYTFHTDAPRRSAPESVARYRGDGTLEAYEMVLRGHRLELGDYTVDAIAPYFNPTLRECRFTLGHGHDAGAGPLQSVDIADLIATCTDHADPFASGQNEGLTRLDLVVERGLTVDSLSRWASIVGDPEVQYTAVERTVVNDQVVLTPHTDDLAFFRPGWGSPVPMSRAPEPFSMPQSVTPRNERVVGPNRVIDYVFAANAVAVAGLSLHLSAQPILSQFTGPWSLTGSFEPFTPAIDPEALRWAVPAEVPLPSHPALPTVAGLPHTPVDAYITDYLFDQERRRLDARYAHRDVAEPDDDQITLYTWERPDTRGFWYRLTDLVLSDRHGNQHSAMHRSDFVHFDHAQTVERCGQTAASCTTEGYTFGSTGAIASHTFADGESESFTPAWCGRLAAHADAVGRTRAFAYDDACRLTQTTFQGGSVSLDYDGFNRRIRTTRSSGDDSPDVVIEHLFDDAPDILVDSGFDEPRQADLRGDGQLTLVYRDEYGRTTRVERCTDGGGSGGDGILGAVSCAADTRLVASWRGFSNDGYVVARAGAHFPDEAPATTRVARDAHGRVQVRLAPAATASPSWAETVTTFGPGWVNTRDALARDHRVSTSTLERSHSIAGQPQLTRRYDAFGQLAEIEGPQNDLITLTRDDHNRVEAVTRGDTVECIDETGSTVTCTWTEQYAYDVRGRRTHVTAADGRRSHVEFDAIGRPVERAVGRGVLAWDVVERIEYDDINLIERRFDEADNETVRQLDPLGRVRSEATLGLTSAWTWGPNDKPATVAGPDGLMTTLQYDPYDRLTHIDSPTAGPVERTYDGAGRLIETTDADGVARGSGYLYSGHLADRTVGGWTVEAYERDALGRLAIASRGGVRSQYTFDDFDNLVELRNGLDADDVPDVTHALTYSDAHRLVSRVSTDDSATHSTSWTHDAWGRVVTATDPMGAMTTFDYDVVGRLRFETDAEAYVREQTYDERGRLSTRDLPGRGTLSYAYTAGDSVDGTTKLFRVDVTDGAGDTTSRWTDGLGRLRFAELGDGAQRRYTYDALRLAQTDWLAPDGTVLREKRNLFDPSTGRLQTVAGPGAPGDFPDGIYQVDYTWTAAGRPLTIETPGETTTFGYDADGLLETESYAGLTRTLLREDDYPWVSGEDLVGAGAMRSTRTERDVMGRLIARTVTDGVNPSELHTWSDFDVYGNPGVVRAEVDGQVVEHRWTYELNGLPAARETFDGAVLQGRTGWQWFDNGVLERIETPSGRSIVHDYGATFDHSLDRVHDGAGHDYAVFQARNGRGQVTAVQVTAARRTFDYDGVGRTIERTSGPLVGPPNTIWTGIHDPLGKLTYEEYTAPDAAWINEYTYDGAGRLVQEIHGQSGRTYDYLLDAAGNRLTTEITELGVTEVALTAAYAGDTLETVDGVDLAYDDWLGVIEDQRGQIIERTASGSIRAVDGGERHDIVRDAAGVPVRSTSPMGQRATTWGLSAETWPLEVAAPDGAVHTYVTAEGLLLERTTIEPAGTVGRSQILTDETGTMDAVNLDSLGGATAFGAGLDPVANEQFAFQKLESLPGVESLLLARRRAYDPETGRFLSPDPTGLRGGLHRTMYGNGDPVQFHDPMGLVAVMIDGMVQDLHGWVIQAMLGNGTFQHVEETVKTDINFGWDPAAELACGPHDPCDYMMRDHDDDDDAEDEEEVREKQPGDTRVTEPTRWRPMRDLLARLRDAERSDPGLDGSVADHQHGPGCGHDHSLGWDERSDAISSAIEDAVGERVSSALQTVAALVLTWEARGAIIDQINIYKPGLTWEERLDRLGTNVSAVPKLALLATTMTLETAGEAVEAIPGNYRNLHTAMTSDNPDEVYAATQAGIDGASAMLETAGLLTGGVVVVRKTLNPFRKGSPYRVFDPWENRWRDSETGRFAKPPERPEHEVTWYYRGVYGWYEQSHLPPHPEIGNSRKGIVIPGDVNGTVTPLQHNTMDVGDISQFTSWTRSPQFALMMATRNGPGGVVLRASSRPPAPGETWKWVESPDLSDEMEVLLEGARSGVKVHEARYIQQPIPQDGKSYMDWWEDAPIPPWDE